MAASGCVGLWPRARQPIWGGGAAFAGELPPRARGGRGDKGARNRAARASVPQHPGKVRGSVAGLPLAGLAGSPPPLPPLLADKERAGGLCALLTPSNALGQDSARPQAPLHPPGPPLPGVAHASSGDGRAGPLPGGDFLAVLSVGAAWNPEQAVVCMCACRFRRPAGSLAHLGLPTTHIHAREQENPGQLPGTTKCALKAGRGREFSKMTARLSVLCEA